MACRFAFISLLISLFLASSTRLLVGSGLGRASSFWTEFTFSPGRRLLLDHAIFLRLRGLLRSWLIIVVQCFLNCQNYHEELKFEFKDDSSTYWNNRWNLLACKLQLKRLWEIDSVMRPGKSALSGLQTEDRLVGSECLHPKAGPCPLLRSKIWTQEVN